MSLPPSLITQETVPVGTVFDAKTRYRDNQGDLGT
jgi:hypothetical protein